jgi:hypothetical protein
MQMRKFGAELYILLAQAAECTHRYTDNLSKVPATTPATDTHECVHLSIRNTLTSLHAYRYTHMLLHTYTCAHVSTYT